MAPRDSVLWPCCTWTMAHRWILPYSLMNKLGLNWLELLVTFSFVHAADGFTEAAGSEQCTTEVLKKSQDLSRPWADILPVRPSCLVNKIYLLYSWRFSRYSASFHWLVHGHMTSNNETVSRQMPCAGNIAKAMTSNGKQFTVTLSTAVARNGWNLSAVFKFCFCFVLLYNKSLNDWSLGEQCILFPSTSSRETLRFSGNKIHCSRRDQSLSVKYHTSE